MDSLVFILPDSTRCSLKPVSGESLLGAARRAGLALDAPCGGRGVCGKCRVRVRPSPPPGNASRAKLSAWELESGWRLACDTEASAGLSVEAGAALARNLSVTAISGKREEAAFAKLKAKTAPDTGISLKTLALCPPGAGESMADAERAALALKADSAGNRAGQAQEVKISLSALRKLPAALRETGFKVEVVVREEGEQRTAETGVSSTRVQVIDVRKWANGNPLAAPLSPLPSPLYGLAIDIGTTTAAALLVDMETGEIAASANGANTQTAFGADVISRIIEAGKPGGLERLRAAIIDGCLSPLVKSLCAQACADGEDIYRVSLAGNTTMTHLALGVPPDNIRLDPYIPAFFAAKGLRARDAGLPVNAEAEAVIAPAVGSYVGGDITAGVFAAKYVVDGAFSEGLTLFCDLGTNGELVLGGPDFLLTCACSAGPAFEGGEISCGMRASAGAIDSCDVDPETLESAFNVIGGGEPAGICGSGLISLIDSLFKARVIDGRGKFIRENPKIVRDKWGQAAFLVTKPVVNERKSESESGFMRQITLTETDIDNFIRAKAAIFSAIRAMLSTLDLEETAIDRVIVAGGIGSGLDLRKSVSIGMFPNLPLEKFTYIGNSSLCGAWAALVSRKAEAEIEKIASSMTYIELSSHPGYMDEFTAACFLPHTNAALFS